MNSRRIAFWPMLLIVFLVTRAAINSWVPRLARTPSESEINALVLTERTSACAPESAEQLTFLLALALPVALTFLFAIALQLAAPRVKGRIATSWVVVVALLLQLVLLFVGTSAMEFEVTKIHRYRFLSVTGLGWIAAAVALLFAWKPLRDRIPPNIRVVGRWLNRKEHWTMPLALAFALNYVVQGVFLQGEIPTLTGFIVFHLPYTMGEFAAALNGNTPLIDYFPQYQNLLASLLKPIFRIVGLDLTTFTIAMSFLNAVGFALIFSSLRRVCRSGWAALLLFVPILAIGCYAEGNGLGGYHETPFNYFAIGPIRYLGFCVLARLSIWYLERPMLERLIIVGCSATLVALNNLDFGIPAAVGTLAVALLFPPQKPLSSAPADMTRAAIVFVATALTTVGLVLLLVRLTTHNWPLLGAIAEFQNAFAVLGYFMFALPEKGLFWVVYLTLMAAVLVPVFETFSQPRFTITSERRIVNGSLAFAGVAGTGTLGYYVGRSHPYVLEASFFAWGYVAVQLAHRAFLEWHRPRASRSAGEVALVALPTMMAVGVAALTLPMLHEIPNPMQQYFRLTILHPGQDLIDEDALAMLKKYTQPGATALIDYPHGHLLAIRAGVRNLFPFVDPGSLILREQVDSVMAALSRTSREDVPRFFGSPNIELTERLTENGFRQVDAAGGFAVWLREQP